MATRKESAPTILPSHELSNKWPFDLLEVIWEDAETDHGWKAESQIEFGKELVTTIGFLIKKLKGDLIVGGSIYVDEEGEYNFNTRMQIPKGMIRSLKILVPKNGKSKEPPTIPV
jgi:hypothetical protein